MCMCLRHHVSFCSELESVGVKVHASQGGFYLFPDFSVCADRLRQAGVHVCQDMCDLMLKETDVAVNAYFITTTQKQPRDC